MSDELESQDSEANDAIDKAVKNNQAMIGFGKSDEMMIVLPLKGLDRATARGTLLEADDILKHWYAKQDALKKKIMRPGNLQAMKNKVGKLFTP